LNHRKTNYFICHLQILKKTLH